MMMERLKYWAYLPLYTNTYFWRIYQQQKIDLVEDHAGNLLGYVLKWSQNKKVQAPSQWKETYKNSEFQVIHVGNYLDFILPD